MNDMTLFTNTSILEWLAVSHTLFLVFPGLFAVTDGWLQRQHQVGSFHFNSMIHHAKVARYPHYLSH